MYIYIDSTPWKAIIKDWNCNQQPLPTSFMSSSVTVQCTFTIHYSIIIYILLTVSPVCSCI